MTSPSRFNLRVYGLLIHDDQVLVSEELIRGHTVTKFPGGGVELGEGLAAALIREWKEELDLDIQIGSLFYVNDFYQPSAFDDSQVISFYYRVSSTEIPEEIINLVRHERAYWVPLAMIHSKLFTLPIDREVAEQLRQSYTSGIL